ncbi:hypothetical protein RM543_10495 [Roseicyclus sp. F158]|uniref:Deoxycytidine triphosphate deaminase n=1 Tax=Tropicimonas omnivorans TaxID=3075590 RepID=A0ABU3DHC0_9RHOB|nr:hypothetical protein [Roseicyclus sp. F158]MDT0683116.1 hypothetical protein [Roseicyclus sp. F158]
MTLLAGDKLDKTRFFREGDPIKRASSFDLTVGCIFNDEGQEIAGPYILEPNEMVQVTSAEVFGLPSDITAHVSYKTGMTHKGIWALTVGVVDPGWNCPVSTTLFNFSKVPFAISRGDVFLRVSMFQHSPVSSLNEGPAVEEYERGVRKTAMTTFGRQFLNADKVAEDAGKVAMEKMRNSALMWLGFIAFLFAVLQLAVSWVSPAAVDGWYTTSQFREEIAVLKAQVASLTETVGATEVTAVPDDGSPTTDLDAGDGVVNELDE